LGISSLPEGEATVSTALATGSAVSVANEVCDSLKILIIHLYKTAHLKRQKLEEG
jgi:hypothetical protein